MRVDPAIAALRHDRTPLLQAQAAMFAAREAWRGRPRVAPVLAEVEQFGRGIGLSACPALAALFVGGVEAAGFADDFCAVFTGALTRESSGQLPFRHAFDGVVSTLLLARAGTARLTLVAQEPGEYATTSALFSEAERHDAVIAGAAVARLTTHGPNGAYQHERVRLSAPSRLTLDLQRQTLFVEAVERPLVTLRLHRTAPLPGPVREHSLADGALLQLSAGEMRQSRHEMMLAVLGRMRRRAAAPVMAELACEDGPDTLRWEALRQALALDTAGGFAALSRIACSATDPLAPPAAALRAQLVEVHPELLQFEEAQCRG